MYRLQTHFAICTYILWNFFLFFLSFYYLDRINCMGWSFCYYDLCKTSIVSVADFTQRFEQCGAMGQTTSLIVGSPFKMQFYRFHFYPFARVSSLWRKAMGKKRERQRESMLDSRFELITIVCVGANCAAPAIVVKGKYYNLSPSK